MQGPASAERHEGKTPRIMPALDGNQADRASHACIRDPQDGFRGSLGRKAKGIANLLADRRARGLSVEPFQRAADGLFGIDAPEHDIRIGQRGPRVPCAIGNRARPRARAFRPHAQHAPGIDRRDGTAARADGRDLDHRVADDHAEINRGLRREFRAPAEHEAHIEGGAAEIAGDHIRQARRFRNRRRRDHPRRRARKRRAHRETPRRFGGHHATIGLHDVKPPGEGLARQSGLQLREIAADNRLQAGIERGGRGALEFADFGQNSCEAASRSGGKRPASAAKAAFSFAALA